MKAPRRLCCLLPVLVLLITGCGEEGPPAPPILDWVYRVPEQVDDGWETASLESVGLDPVPMAIGMNALRRQESHRVHGIVIVRHGKLVFEEYFDGLTHPSFGEKPISYDRETDHCLSSVTKSFTATLLGVAIHRGFIESVDEKVWKFFPELVDLNVGPKRHLTLDHLINMTSGIEWDESSRSFRDPQNDIIAWLRLVRSTSADPMRAILERPMVAAPGERFNYSGANSNVVGKAIQNATGQRLDRFAQEHLFAPLGIEHVRWWLLRDDLVYASGDICLRPRDLARFGLMYLNEGEWNGQRILPREWVKSSATKYSPPPDSEPWMWKFFKLRRGHVGYSYGWWLKSDDYGPGAYEAGGWGEQRLMVLPALDMVVVFTGGSYWERPLLSPHEMMVALILPSAGMD